MFRPKFGHVDVLISCTLHTLELMIANPIPVQCGSVVICRSSPAQKAAVVRMMMEYEMSQAEGNSKGLIKWYRRQMKKQVCDFIPGSDPRSLLKS